jgi:alpha-amylase/alpha-mannosidase (GH57 family)
MVYDGAYDKLVVHGFHTYVRIDGASHYVLRAKVTLDKKMEIIFEGYAYIMQSLVLMCESNQILLLNTFLSKNTMLNLQGLG